MRTSIAVAAGIALVGLLAAPAAEAQSAGVPLDRFRPADRASDWFALDSLDLRGNWRPALGVTGYYAARPLTVYDNQTDDVRFAPVKSQLVVHPGASIRIADRFRLALDLPIALTQSGTAGTVNGTPVAAGDKGGVGDLRVGGDIRVFGEYGDAATLAIGLQAFLPTGSREQYLGDGSTRLLPRVQLAGEVGAFVYALSTGTMIRTEGRGFVDQRVGSEFVYGAAAGVKVAKSLVLGPELIGGTSFASGAGGSREQTPLELLLGGHLQTGDFKLGAGAGIGLDRAIGVPTARGLLSLDWFPAAVPPDRDGDGIIDAEDACPDVRGIRSPIPEKNGCPPPPPPPDRDGDGIIDMEDACPDVQGVRTDDPKTNGCPPDRDHDGIYDKDDACIDVPGVKTSDPKTNGCPPDRDHDGIYDKDDACIDVPGIKSDNPAFNGCPVDIDSDAIENPVDACPREAGDPSPDPKKHGCPRAKVTQGKIEIRDQVKFVTDSSKIDSGKDSEDVLKAVLKILTEHPEITKVSVEGHTDARGGAAHNRALSNERSKSVVKWLVAHGVDAKRLTSKGFGPDRPIDSNDTEEGRRNNRRSEFIIVEGPSGDAAPPDDKKPDATKPTEPKKTNATKPEEKKQ